MGNINFNNKKFALITNSENGTVNAETIFHYQQDGQLVTADYAGGTIRYGKIIAHLNGETLEMLYQCLTTENELKAGKATAQVKVNAQGKLQLALDWQWLSPNSDTIGTSEYVEID